MLVAQEEGQEEEALLSSVYPKANSLNRFIAKFLDLLIVSAIAQVPLKISFLAALSYLLLSDGFAGGKSIGKQLIGLQTLSDEPDQETSFRESIIRNISLGIAYLLAQIPVIGWLLGLGLIGFESLLLLGNAKGRRVGDELAGTQVIDQGLHPSEK